MASIKSRHADIKQISQASWVLCRIRLHTKGLSLHVLLTTFFSAYLFSPSCSEKKTHKKPQAQTLIWVTLNFQVARFKPSGLVFSPIRDMKFWPGSERHQAAQSRLTFLRRKEVARDREGGKNISFQWKSNESLFRRVIPWSLASSLKH